MIDTIINIFNTKLTKLKLQSPFSFVYVNFQLSYACVD